MAYSSSSASYSSTRTWKYDVFLSFRGEDTGGGGGFTDHLYKALVEKGICTFKDDNEMEEVTDISSKLLAAIEVSRVAVVVVSENYASSRRCLGELVKIFKCKKEMGMEIMPIFYKVDPSDVRNERGSSEEAFVKHDARYGEDKLEVLQWRKSLFEIANLKAWVSNDWSHESEIIEDVCEAIMRIIKPTLTLIEKGQLIGLSSKLDQLSSLLNPNSDDNVNVMVVGIHGMGGIGKTTIARALYERICNEFEAHCFFSNVGEEFKISEITHLQSRLLSRITFSMKKIDVRNDREGIALISKAIFKKKTLVVLDDVDRCDQIWKLIPYEDYFGYGSRIIITTRNADLLLQYGVKLNRMFEMKVLEHEEALQLLSLNAFKERCPKEGYLEHSNYIVQLVGGHPLAITTLGRSFLTKDLSVWDSVIERLRGGWRIDDKRFVFLDRDRTKVRVLNLRAVQPSVDKQQKSVNTRKPVAAEPILQRFSSLESRLSCLDGLSEMKKLNIEQEYLHLLKTGFESSDGYSRALEQITRDYFCLLQGGEGRSYIDLMEKLLRLRNQLMEQENEYISILRGKCSKNKEDVLQNIVLSRRGLECAEKVYLISRSRSFSHEVSTNWTPSDQYLLKRMISQRKGMMKLEAEYVELLQAGAAFFDHERSQCTEDVLRAVSSRRECLGLEVYNSDGFIEEGKWSMFDVQPIYFKILHEVTMTMVSLWEQRYPLSVHPNLAHDFNTDSKISRSLEWIVTSRKVYLELEDEYLCLLLERYDNTSTSYDVRQIHSEYFCEYVLEMILRWRTDLTLLEDIHACQLMERQCLDKSAHEFVKLFKELKQAEEEYCKLVRERHVTILDSISSMDVTQIYAKYNHPKLLDHIESLRVKMKKLAIDCLHILRKCVSVVVVDSQHLEIETTRIKLHEIEDQYFCRLEDKDAAKHFLQLQQTPQETKGEEEKFLKMLYDSIKSCNFYCTQCSTCINNMIQHALKLEDDDELSVKFSYEDEEVPENCYQVLHKFLKSRSICCPACMSYVRRVTIKHARKLEDKSTAPVQASTTSILNLSKGGEESHQERSVIMVPTEGTIATPILQPNIRVRRWEIRKSMVLGGLIQSITSLVIITAATSANISDGNIVALALTNLITGFFIIRHEVSGLQKKSKIDKRCTRIQVEGSHYKELLKEKMYYLLNFIIAFLSFLLFGLVPPLVYALSSLKTRNKNLKIIAAAGASLSCTAFLAIQKAYIQKPKNSLVYVKIAAIYLAIGVGAFGISYLAGCMFGYLVEKLSLVL